MLRTLDAPLLERWDALALACDAAPFLRPGWTAAWARAFGRAGALRLLTVERGGDLVAALPLLTSPFGLRSPTNGETALFAPIAADSEAAAELGDRLVALRTPAIRLDALPGEDPHTAALPDAARRAGAAVLVRPLRRSPYIDVSGDPVAFRKGLSKNRRHGLRRLQNRMREAGEVTLTVHDGRGDDDLEPLLADGFRLEAREWKRAAGSAILSSPAAVDLYTTGARWAAGAGILRLAFLRLDGRPIAFGYCLQQGGVLFFLKLGMDDSLAKLGPGVVFTQHLIDYAFADPGTTELDLLGENEAYKADLADGTREQVRLQIFPSRVAGPAQRAAVAGAGLLRAAVVERLTEGTRDRLSAVRNRLRR
ncbi:hypothetical protein GCM10023175_38290 [Pseudonocardia xishanensis]|uniref:BioF2-like acetyltransferase domain-containing protein n=1 Tax=Pseudonocardia xishanensis TaxID=630995 RepID=A0ABP8RVR3_9PSEU